MGKVNLFNYLGSKVRLSDWIIEHIPEHDVYVEVFGGSLAIFLNKPLAKINVINDINKDLVDFYKEFKSDNSFKKMVKDLALIPYSRKEFYSALEGKGIPSSYRTFVIQQYSYSASRRTWGYITTSNTNAPLNRLSKFKHFEFIKSKIEKATIENLDFREIIQKYDSEKTFFYLDPPYVHTTRRCLDNRCQYDIEMSIEEHNELVDILLKIKGKVMLSGYDNEIYKKLEKNGWTRKEKELHITPKTVRGQKREKAVECIWMNYKI